MFKFDRVMAAIAKREKILIPVIFGIYTAVTYSLAINHESWFDEGMAWVIARDVPLSGLFDVLTHEGHPALWYLILMPFAKLGMPVLAMNIASWLIMCLGVLVLLYRAPFSLPVKAAAVFSAGMLYINVTVARSYCMIPLILFLIATVYPNRRKHPIVYGILVGLLANTHVMMCGLVAVLGIMMFIDIIKSFKARTSKENILSLIGLFIAGLLVLAVVVPLFNSLSTNSMTSENNYDISSFIFGIASSFNDISALMFGKGQLFSSILPLHLLSTVVYAAVIVMTVILIRRKKNVLIIFIVTYFVQIIVSGVIWFGNPNRAAVTAITLFFIYWLYASSDEAVKERKISSDNSSVIGTIEKIDRNNKSVSSVVISVLMVATIPLGVYFVVKDLSGSFSPDKATGEYIADNLPDDAVIVTDGEWFTSVSAYAPEVTLWDGWSERYYTYCYHDDKTLIQNDGSVNIVESVKRNFTDTENVYLLLIVNDDWISAHADTEFEFIARSSVNFSSALTYVLIQFDNY